MDATSPLNYLVQTMPHFLQSLQWKRRQGLQGDEFLEASTPWVAGKILTLMWRKGAMMVPDIMLTIQDGPHIGLYDVFSGHCATYEAARQSLLRGIQNTEYLTEPERAMYLAAFNALLEA